MNNGAPLKFVELKTIQLDNRIVEMASMEDAATGACYPVLISSHKNAPERQPVIEIFDRKGDYITGSGSPTTGNIMVSQFEMSRVLWSVSFFSAAGTIEKAKLFGKVSVGTAMRPPYITMFSLAPQMEIVSARFNGDTVEYYRPRGAMAFFVILPESGAAGGTIEFELKLNEAANDEKSCKKLGITPEERISYSSGKQYAALRKESYWNVQPPASGSAEESCFATATFDVPSDEFLLSSSQDSYPVKKMESQPKMELTIAGDCRGPVDDRIKAFKAKKQKIILEGSESEIIYQDDKAAETVQNAFSNAVADFTSLLGPLNAPRGLKVVIDPNDDGTANSVTGSYYSRVNGDFINLRPGVIIESSSLYHEYFHAWVHGICEKNTECRGKPEKASAYFYNETFAYFFESMKTPADIRTALNVVNFTSLDNYLFGPKMPSVISFENSEQYDTFGGTLYNLTFKKGLYLLKALAAKFGADVVKKSIGEYISSGRMFAGDARFIDFFNFLKDNGADADSFYKSWIEGSKFPAYCLKQVSFSENGRGKGILRVTLEQKAPFYDLKLPIYAGEESLVDMEGKEYINALEHARLVGTAEFSTGTAAFEFEIEKAPETVYAYMPGKTQYPFPENLKSKTGFSFAQWEIDRFPRAMVVLPEKDDCGQPSALINFLTYIFFKSVDCAGYNVADSEFDDYRSVFVVGNPAKNRYLGNLMKNINPASDGIQKLLNGEVLPAGTGGVFLRSVVPIDFRDAKIDWLMSFGAKPEPDPEEYPQARQFFFINYMPGFPLEKALNDVFLFNTHLPNYFTSLVFDSTGSLVGGSFKQGYDPTYALRDAASGEYTTHCDLSEY